jgi:hypothetical protein
MHFYTNVVSSANEIAFRWPGKLCWDVSLHSTRQWCVPRSSRAGTQPLLPRAAGKFGAWTFRTLTQHGIHIYVGMSRNTRTASNIHTNWQKRGMCVYLHIDTVSHIYIRIYIYMYILYLKNVLLFMYVDICGTWIRQTGINDLWSKRFRSLTPKWWVFQVNG